MAEQVLMAALSPTMDVGTLVKWHKKVGDFISSGDVICEVETDKATMDYESSSEGTLLKILIGEGERAKVGDAIAVIGEEGENIDELLTSASAEAVVEAKQTDLKAPADEQRTPAAVSQTIAATGNDNRIKASPLARRIAEQNEIKLSELKGTGPEGRIIKADVDKAVQLGSVKAEPVTVEKPVKTVAPAAQVQIRDTDEAVPVSNKRRIIAQRLSESKYSSPHFYLTVSVAVDNLISTRKKLNEIQNVKVSFNALLIKFAAEALRKHPMANASWQGDIIVKHKNADIGLAVAQPDGLITPIVRDCGSKGIIEIEKTLQELIEKARNNTLVPDEYQGATFTISNLGSFGIEEFTAIINPPGAAILAVGEMKKVPVVDSEDNIKIQTQMKLTLSCDHRVLDGAVGAAFLKNLKDIIENPISALY